MSTAKDIRLVSLPSQYVCEKHEECRQAFVRTTMLIRDHIDGLLTLENARYELMRANAAVAQGMVWAELIGVDPSGWLSRMAEVQTLWEQVNA